MRFRRPVFADDPVRCTPVVAADGSCRIEATTDQPEQPRAVLVAVKQGGPALMRKGDVLPSRRVALTGEWGADYGLRADDDLDVFARLGVVHPAVWPALANAVVHADVARGSWIHTRSIVRHHAVAQAGSIADVHAVVVRRYESHGERAVLDVQIEVDGALVASLEHEAIVSLT